MKMSIVLNILTKIQSLKLHASCDIGTTTNNTVKYNISVLTAAGVLQWCDARQECNTAEQCGHQIL